MLRTADDAAVAAGVTVVVSAGDAGPTSTIESPASDPGVISVGATTTFQSYAQSDEGGFYNPAVGNGTWDDNNLSSLSSGGYTQSGSTIDLVAPGDANWALCSTDATQYTDCADSLRGKDIGVESFGGTSEASPLTAAAAADVIEAYSQAHHGTDPSPALVKEILCSTATDIGAPAAEQGAGLLNVAGAVALARSLPSRVPVTPIPTTTTTLRLRQLRRRPQLRLRRRARPRARARPARRPPRADAQPPRRRPRQRARDHDDHRGEQRRGPAGGRYHRARGGDGGPPALRRLLVSPSQLNVVGKAGAVTRERLTLTNTGPATTTVHLSTRALTQKIL